MTHPNTKKLYEVLDECFWCFILGPSGGFLNYFFE